MCLVIQIENVISNYFALNVNKERVSLTTLGIYKDRIEQRFRNDKNRFVLIDYTKSSLVNAIMLNSDFFDFKNEEVVYIKGDEHKALIHEMSFFNSKLPRSVKEDYLEIFESINSTCYELGLA